MIKKFFNKENRQEVLSYLIFGVLTTLVNYLAYFLFRKLGMHYLLATVMAWVLAVLFAFFTNRRYVFRSQAQTNKEKWIEVGTFFAGRLASLGLDALILFIGIDLLHQMEHEFLIKLIANIVEVIVNYFWSKLIVFRTRRAEVRSSE